MEFNEMIEEVINTFGKDRVNQEGEAWLAFAKQRANDMKRPLDAVIIGFAAARSAALLLATVLIEMDFDRNPTFIHIMANLTGINFKLLQTMIVSVREGMGEIKKATETN